MRGARAGRGVLENVAAPKLVLLATVVAVAVGQWRSTDGGGIYVYVFVQMCD